MKKLSFFVFLPFLILINFTFFNHSTFAQESKLNLYFFYSPTCSHCEAEGKFLDKIEPQYPEVTIRRYNVYAKENQGLLFSLAQRSHNERFIGSVPMLFIEKNSTSSDQEPILILGFDNENEMGKKIQIAIQSKLQNIVNDSNNKVRVPFLGNIDISKYSIFALTIILGLLDGFNVCSLGALIFILGLVLVFRSRKKILIFGSIFILTTAVSYGVLMFLWYQLFSVLSPYIKIMNILVGLVSLIGGIYFIREFLKFRKQGVLCETEQKSKTISKLSFRLSETFKNNKNIFIIVGAIFVFSALVAIIEFPCSAAVPVVYAGILSQAGLSSLQYLLYLSLYLILYLLDELIVFLIASFTMKIWFTSQKTTLWVTLIEAIILSSLGLYYLLSVFR